MKRNTLTCIKALSYAILAVILVTGGVLVIGGIMFGVIILGFILVANK